MLQADSPGDFVLATNRSATVRDFLEATFEAVGLDWRHHVEYDARYVRPTEVDSLIGDYSKAERELAWKPSVFYQDLAEMMVSRDYELHSGRQASAEKLIWRY